ncbi:AraC family transcriptional regulator [Streptomyces sp. NRRL WC-3742]|uniref:AraC family transcriptional regulator n=1 Tax=Streptomyces sp. NRRL WC-3742 TaxID=1463934 RepID=UPI0004CBDEF6|nr:AraC family transcriptional regulator [Streptomyces sp. NRRL WC-3742]
MTSEAEAGPLCLYEGGDIEEFREVVGARLSPHRLTVLGRRGGPPGASRLRAFHEGRVALYDLSYGAPVRLRTEELPDFYNVILPHSGHGTVVANGTALPSPLSVAGPGDVVLMEWDHPALNSAFVIARRTIEEALAARTGDVPREPLRFRPVLDPADPAVRSWLELVGHFREFAVSPLGRRSPLAVRHFEQALIEGLLDVQPHSWSRAAGGHGPAILPSALRRATDFCAEHADEAVSVADIAQAARVGLPALREGFRRHLDTTPLAHLRRVRLDRAHQDLLAVAQGRASGTVTEIACRWGFTHLGRFSAEYRRAYGRTPSETLRRTG